MTSALAERCTWYLPSWDSCVGGPPVTAGTMDWRSGTTISEARRQVEQLKPDDDPSWLYWMAPTAITLTAGNCHLLLGQAEQGAVLIDKGIAELGESFVRDRQLHLTQLADARARPGKQRDLDAAAGLGMQSLDLVESLDSTRGVDLLRDLYVSASVPGEIVSRTSSISS